MNQPDDRETPGDRGDRDGRWTELLHAYRRWSRRPARRGGDEGARRVVTALESRGTTWLRPALAATVALLVLALGWLVGGDRRAPTPGLDGVATSGDSRSAVAVAVAPTAREPRWIVHTLKSGTRLIVVLPERRPARS